MVYNLSVPGACLAVAIIASGLLLHWLLRWRKVSADQGLDTFFLGGGDVGNVLTKHTNWGLCFAFANAVWYFAFLGYSFGPWSFLFQIPWSASVIVIAFSIQKYIDGSANGTVHGFLEVKYGENALRLATLATIAGYIINLGFEVFFSTKLLATALGITDFTLILTAAVVLSMFAAGYCAMGGYRANAVTDRVQNWLGAAATLLLIVLLTPAFAATTGGIWPWSFAASEPSLFATPSWHFILGISVFAFFFNFVDMANWQSLAANRALDSGELQKVKRGLIFSSFYQMIAPALLGTWLGVILRALDRNLADQSYFAAAFQTVFSWFELSPVVAGGLLGFLLLGFLSITISSADSYLLAAVQTLAVDVFRRKELQSNKEKRSHEAEYCKQTEAAIIEWSRRALFSFAVASVLVFAFLYLFIKDSVFSFQGVMYGSAVTLTPTVLLGLFAHKNLQPSHGWAFGSILSGLLAVFVPFAVAMFFWEGQAQRAILDLAPVFGLVTSTLVCATAIVMKQTQKE